MVAGTDIKPDYEFYTGTYHGQMAEADFTSVLPDALAEVEDRLWPPAVNSIAAHVADCKMAVCAVAELIGNPAKRRTSYSAGKVSESFEMPFSLTAEAAIVRYLGRFHVLARGAWL